jgi:fructan beta-fructosidase
VTFYSSTDLKSWTKESEFGKNEGSHGGVWECPDLFSLNYLGKKIWVLIVSINPGGPNGGSATQYFTGKFNGKTFTPFETNTKWIDYGRDDYAGITWSNTGDRKIFIGWMSNWQYAEKVPTIKWKSTTTIPRDLGIAKVGSDYLITSKPVKELNTLINNTKDFHFTNSKQIVLGQTVGSISSGTSKINLVFDRLESFSLTLSNNIGEKLIVGFDKGSNKYFIDRSKSGKIDFENSFAGIHAAPRLSDKINSDITLVIDQTSIELFADNGLSVLTDIFFPNKPFDKIEIESKNSVILKKMEYNNLKSIWQ